MCIGPVALSAISTAFSVVGAVQSANAQQAQSNYQARVAAQNARVAEWQAESAEARGVDAAIATGRNQAMTRGRQAAALAANGLDLSSGSPAAILEQTDYYGLQDQKAATQNASDEAWGLRTKGANYAAESSLASARASGSNPLLAGGTALLGGAANVAEKWKTQNPGKTFWGS